MCVPIWFPFQLSTVDNDINALWQDDWRDQMYKGMYSMYCIYLKKIIRYRILSLGNAYRCE